MTTFRPSNLDAAYGYENDPYAAQEILTTFPRGYGDYGLSEGAGFALQGAAGLASGLIGLSMQSAAEKKQREHELELAKEQRRLLRIQAEAGLLEGEEGSWVPWVVGGLLIVSLAGGVGLWGYKKKGWFGGTQEG